MIASSSAVSIRHLAKQFGGTRALDDVSLEIGRGQFVTVLGPSGCGKTTLLRSIAGFVVPDAGEVAIDGVAMNGWPPYRRPTALVFQNYALFPHLSVAGNVAFGLRERSRPERLAKAAIAEWVEHALSLVELGGMGPRRISALSGGQQQRVALARALVLQPTILLLDEPLGALDVLLRRQMQGMLKHLQRQTGITFLAVTHDQEEALTMSDRIVVMHDGRIEQDGAPEEVFARPRTRFVAEFMGDGRRNLFPVERLPDGTMLAGGLPLAASDPEDDGQVWAMVQPSRLHLVPSGTEETIPAGMCQWETRVADMTYRGATVSVETATPSGTRAIADLDAADVASIRAADPVMAWFDPADVTFVPDSVPTSDPERLGLR
ncbi:MAG: ABC transporter ATP-binding protein [Thermomicrobiales bacterium]